MNLLPTYEVWTWIEGCEGRYEISNRGRIRSWVKAGGFKHQNFRIFRSTPLIMKTNPNRWGYLHVGIGHIVDNKKRVSVRIHREVAKIYNPNSNPITKNEVNHINGLKYCNEWWNFEWVDRMESIDHAFRTGLIIPAKGEEQSNTKLTNEMVLRIYQSKQKTRLIAAEFNISTHAVLDIKRGRTWWHLTGHPRHIKPCEYGRFKKAS